MHIHIEGSENIDSLPYLDPILNKDEKALINEMIEEEMNRFIPSDYLSQIAPTPNFDYNKYQFLEEEMKRLKEGRKQIDFDNSRYQLKVPTIENENNWKDSLENAKSQYEYQEIQKLNLDLLLKYGGNQWKLYLSDLEMIQKNLKLQLKEIQDQIEQINLQRKLEQESSKSRIEQNNRKWFELVHKNKEIELACHQLELEIESIQSQ
ncbi:spliceosome-associated protein [Tieghemostelium lacteum]|uniref:Spliceosome-associated protein n=1 Tax=Tieghemostelium lacteum TaxID=361077 RepID=A0A151Z2I4_TIELA|nr:spliceosome-associated protein [Tieghemostelium lacteum]|eukprot:KYQ88172.1 spliceosome-associated protein [Tieghemostelium lacteum]